MDLVVIRKSQTGPNCVWDKGYNCHKCPISFSDYLQMENHYLTNHEDCVLFLLDEKSEAESIVKRFQPPGKSSDAEVDINNEIQMQVPEVISMPENFNQVLENATNSVLQTQNETESIAADPSFATAPDWEVINSLINSSGFTFDEATIEEIAAEIARNNVITDEQLMSINPDYLSEFTTISASVFEQMASMEQ